MECVPDLAFLQMAAASSNEMLNKMIWHSPNSGGGGGGHSTTMKQRKTNFTSREVEALLAAVADRKDTVLFGVAGGLGWARAWHEVAQQVSAVEGIHRSESDVRKKWTYLKWEAKNTSKPGRDPTSRAVLDILTSRDVEAPSSNSLLEQLLVPQGSPSSTSPVPIAPKKSVPPPPPQPSQPPEVCLKWNSYHSNMQATFPSLLNNEQFVDVTLACEGRSIKCHKVMLSACSSYFEELLSQNPCQHPIVFMRDLKFWEVQALVEFMYSGEVNVAQEKLPSLLAAAEALQIKGLTGPSSTSSNHDDDPLGSGETDDGHPQPQKRIRKRKSAHPVAYPIRIQNTPSPSPSGNQMQTQQTSTSQQQQQPQQQQTPLQVQKIKVPIMSSLPGSSHHREEPSYHPPVRIKREHSSTPPLALLKDEPLDLGIDSSERNKEENNGQVYNSTLQDAINRLHGKQLSLNQGPGLVKMESNGGLSEDDGSGSERSPIQTDPGEAGDA
ncbi:protein bric-a-brac 1 isoform X2 [Halyomorpha halys]|uniref:protein bric-a-brac 1 isoform X2 n=1 Tax=Halyomorpha halys TaxID=286706 RepID=UPI0006D51326|nr:protein bric-a-brac 1-like isoform X2 [Halyomorpha halys]